MDIFVKIADERLLECRCCCIIAAVMKMKIAYAGFDLMAAAFEALCAEHEVMRLFTCRVDGVFETNERVISLAERKNIPYTFDRITPEDVGELVQNGCELLTSAGYYYLIPVDDRLPMVNIHPSLLPYGRGAWPMPLAILDGLTESGVTVHKTEESFDTGAILLQERFDLAPDENLDTFMNKVNALLPDMIVRLTGDFAALWRNAREQGEGVYQDEPSPEDYVLSKDAPAPVADRVLRAFWGYYTVYDDGVSRRRIRRGRCVFGAFPDVELPVSGGFIEIVEDF